MKHKLLTKFFVSILLTAVALGPLGLLFGNVNAEPPDPTPSPTIDIRTKLRPYQTPGVESSQSDGRTLKVAPQLSAAEKPPIGALAQQTFYAIADATVLQGYPTENLGDTADMWAGYDDSLQPDGRIVRSLVRFNITSLPSNQAITAAKLRLYLVTSWDFPNTSRTVTTYRVISSWTEGGVTWANQPGYGSAYDSTSIVHGSWAWYEFDVTDLVKAWYEGTYPNYGIMLRGPETSGVDSGWRGFSTREGPYRPQLVIETTISMPTPTPTDTPTATATFTPTPTKPPAATATFTSTPTSAPPTSAPTAEWKAHLPIVMKNWSPPSPSPIPTSTPDSTPPPSPTVKPTVTPIRPTVTPIKPTVTPCSATVNIKNNCSCGLTVTGLGSSIYVSAHGSWHGTRTSGTYYVTVKGSCINPIYQSLTISCGVTNNITVNCY